MVDWQDFTEKWAQKTCQGTSLRKIPQEHPSEKDQQNNESVYGTTKDVDLLRKSIQQQHKYESSWWKWEEAVYNL